MKDELIQDIVCQVLYENKSKKIFYLVLHEFLPNFQEIHKQYGKPKKDNYEFSSENELISFYTQTPNISQSLYWNEKVQTVDKIVVGANITSDNKIVFSVTIDGTEKTEAKTYLKLKHILNSKIGVISYVNPAEYESGEDFIKKYGHIKYKFEK